MVIRPANINDAREISGVYVQTWKDTYLGLVPLDYLFDMSPGRLEHAFFKKLNTGRHINYVAEETGRIVGFVSGGDERHNDHIYSGEIHALYVLRDCQRRGIGAQLVSALAARLNDGGVYSMQVKVLARNPYRRFYEKINGIYLRTQRRHFAGQMLDIAVYGWIDTGLVDTGP